MLTVSDLSQPNIQRAQKNHETYKLLYLKCAEHIKRKHSVGCRTTIYDIPEFVVGRPTFTHSHAIRYVSDKLRRGGFDVHKDEHGVLTIDWTRGVRRALRRSDDKRRQKKKSTKPASDPKAVPLSIRLANLSKSLKTAGAR